MQSGILQFAKFYCGESNQIQKFAQSLHSSNQDSFDTNQNVPSQKLDKMKKKHQPQTVTNATKQKQNNPIDRQINEKQQKINVLQSNLLMKNDKTQFPSIIPPPRPYTCSTESLHHAKQIVVPQPAPTILPQNVIETQKIDKDLSSLIEKKRDQFKSQKRAYNEKELYIGKINDKYQSRQGLGLWKNKNTSARFILGEWKNDEIDGLGYSQFKTGKIQFFMGEYKDSLPAQGYMRDEQGAQYYGSFQNGVPNGTGMFIFPKKDYTYRGGFKNGKFHGKGELLNMVKQRTVVGEWNQGKLEFMQDSKFYLGFDLEKPISKEQQEEKKTKAIAIKEEKEKQTKALLAQKQVFKQDIKQYELLKDQNPEMFKQVLKNKNIDPDMFSSDLMKSWSPASKPQPKNAGKTIKKEEQKRKMRMIDGKLRFMD